MTKQEIARELKTLSVTLTASQIKKASKNDLAAMLEKAKKSNVVALPKKARVLADRVLVEHRGHRDPKPRLLRRAGVPDTTADPT